ncbi:vWA domain-containing protein [Roseimaritima sediminicola]|uniref:vWA domain-containing protein n=1 Tax=Roseimaritima sediminicola TaxID=2662066 RepID=UPI0012984BD1|nr:BatA and WFA domain-containing protein [Roseimaritima sediminicola]
MSYLPALAAWQWALLAVVPIGIVLLYFLKLRRQPMVVPSTFLWSRTIEDLHVNSLLQRLRRSLLLLLQLLVIAMAALALLRPGWQSSNQQNERLVLLLDTSASMRATDVDEEESRFEAAKKKVRERIDRMDDTDVAMLIAFNDRAEVLQSFTSDRNRLREALERARQSDRPTDVLDALKAAAGLANPNRTSEAGDAQDYQVADAQPAQLLIYSDGGFPNVTDFDLENLQATYIPVGTEDAANLAIVAFSAQRNPETPEQVEAFARVANTGTERQRLDATLFMDDQFLDAIELDIPAGEEAGAPFQLSNAAAAELKLVLNIVDDNGRPVARDELALDNTAYAAIAPMRTVSVLLVSEGNHPLELALQTPEARRLCLLETVSPAYLQSDAYQERATGGLDDLIIYDRCAPQQMPVSNTMFIGSLPPAGWQWGEPTSPVLLIDIDRTHPLMRFLELYSLQIVEGRPLTPPQGSVDLLTADSGAVMAVSPREGYQDLVVGFDILSDTEEGMVFNSDWPVQRSWPVFVLNVLRHLGGAIDSSSSPSYPPGETVTMRVDNRLKTVDLTDPSGRKRTLQVAAGGTVSITDTDQPGLYLLSKQELPLGVFTVNLFDLQESRLQRPAVRLIGPVAQFDTEYVVGEAEDGARIAEAMLALEAGTEPQIQAWLDDGVVRRNDAPIDPDATVRSGDRITIIDLDRENAILRAEEGAATVAARGELWRWLLLIAVGLLTAEWVLYTRRLM